MKWDAIYLFASLLCQVADRDGFVPVYDTHSHLYSVRECTRVSWSAWRAGRAPCKRVAARTPVRLSISHLASCGKINGWPMQMTSEGSNAQRIVHTREPRPLHLLLSRAFCSSVCALLRSPTSLVYVFVSSSREFRSSFVVVETCFRFRKKNTLLYRLIDRICSLSRLGVRLKSSRETSHDMLCIFETTFNYLPLIVGSSTFTVSI